MQRAHNLLEHLYETYRANSPSAKATTSKSLSEFDSVFMTAILSMTPDQQHVRVHMEMLSTFKWWKVCIAALPYSYH
jgi:hypothetical protein